MRAYVLLQQRIASSQGWGSRSNVKKSCGRFWRLVHSAFGFRDELIDA